MFQAFGDWKQTDLECSEAGCEKLPRSHTTKVSWWQQPLKMGIFCKYWEALDDENVLAAPLAEANHTG